jgi:hypothetical protein
VAAAAAVVVVVVAAAVVAPEVAVVDRARRPREDVAPPVCLIWTLASWRA